MSRLSLESLEARETPASAHPDLYLNVWVNSAEVPAAVGGHTGNLIGIDFRPAAGTSRPIEEIAFVYHKIDLHPDGDVSLKGSKILANSPADKDETLTISQNRTEAADRSVRLRMFALVDRTTLAHDSVWLDLGTPAATAVDSFHGRGILKSVDAGSTW